MLKSLLLCLGLLLPMSAMPVAADSVTSGTSTDQRYVLALRQRGLYRLARLYCQQQLVSGSLNDRQRAEITLQLSFVAVSEAYDSPSESRAPHWQQAHAALDTFGNAGRSGSSVNSTLSPWQLLVDLQHALLRLQQAELQRLEHLDASDSLAMEQVKQLLRQSIAQLRDVASDEVEQRRQQLLLGRSSGRSNQPAGPTADELDGLDRHLRLTLARAYREQGFTYPPNSPDRVNALQQAAELLGRLSQQSPADALVWQARLVLAESLSELGQTKEGLAMVIAWEDDLAQGGAPATPSNSSSPLSAQLLAVHLQLLTTAGRWDEAQQFWQQSQQAQQSQQLAGRSPEVDLALLQMLLTGPTASDSNGDEAVTSLLTTIRQSHAPRWIRQAEARVGRKFAAEGNQATAVGQVHAAEHFYRAGQLREAIAAYDRAAELHRQAKNREAAFGSERAAAALVQKQAKYAEAAQRFRRLALGSLDRDSSSGDHREAILCLAMATRQATESEQPQAMASYIDACREHLRHWTDSSSSEEVRYWLAQAFVARQQWPAAVGLLEEVQAGSLHFDATIEMLATAYRQQAEAMTNPSERQTLVAQATSHLYPIITGSDNRWPAEWTATQRHCVMELARLHLSSGKQDATYATKLLHAALVGSPAPPAAWRQQAIPLLAMALVESGQTAEAIAWLRKGAESPTGKGEPGDTTSDNSLEPLVARLIEQLPSLQRRETERAAVGQLILAAIEIAGSKTDAWQQPVDRYRAAALAAVANEAAARPLYEALIAASPRDGNLQEEYATLLAASNKQPDRTAALEAWLRVESGSRRGSPRWLRARTARIALLTQLGRQQEAQKLHRLTRLLYPQLGNSTPE